VEPGQRTWQNFQEIIAEMGPASDYAVLLAQDGAAPSRKVWPKYFLGMTLAAVAILTILLLPPAISGKLGKGRIVDEIDYPFVNDPELIGKWMSVDFVKEIDDFNPNAKHYRGRQYLKELLILENGRTASPWTWTWTKGLIIHPADKTAAKYHIKEIDGSTYMFFEWKSGDYTIRRIKPKYYVLRKEQSDAN
jgi:bla regulator protein BlaR1